MRKKYEPFIFLFLQTCIAWPFFGYIFRNKDRIPAFIEAHPEVEFGSVSGWYGPGNWISFLLTSTSAISSLLVKIIELSWDSEPSTDVEDVGWNVDIIATVVYSLMVSADFYSVSQQFVTPDTKTLNYAAIPSISAAFRATCIASHIMQLIQILLLACRDHPSLRPRWTKTSFPTYLMVVASSLLSLVVTSSTLTPLLSLPALKPEQEEEEMRRIMSNLNITSSDLSFLRHEFSSLYTEAGIRLPSGLIVEIGSGLILITSPWLRIFISFMLMLVTLFAARVFQPLDFSRPAPGWQYWLCIALFSFAGFYFTGQYLIAALVIPFTALMLFSLYWSLHSIILGGTTIFLAMLPGSGFFPHTGISVLELDQLGTLILFMVVNLVRFKDGLKVVGKRIARRAGVIYRWKRWRRSRMREENPIVLNPL